MSHDFEGTVCDYLVDIHVGGSARTSLDHVYGELFMVLTFDKLLASLNDCVKLLIADKTKLVVCNGSTPFGDCESLDEQGVIFQVKLADFKIFYSSKCLNTIKN